MIKLAKKSKSSNEEPKMENKQDFDIFEEIQKRNEEKPYEFEEECFLKPIKE